MGPSEMLVSSRYYEACIKIHPKQSAQLVHRQLWALGLGNGMFVTNKYNQPMDENRRTLSGGHPHPGHGDDNVIVVLELLASY
jgi:hypothetical protein